MSELNESWWPTMITAGALILLVLVLWWVVKRFRKTYRWYLNRGQDEEKMEEELDMKETLVDQYLDIEGEKPPKP